MESIIVERGKIRNPKRATQLRDFSKIRYDNITPTDIDGVIEYHNKCYVFIEGKVEGTSVPYGQRIALERICNDLRKPSIAIIAVHNVPPEEAVDYSICKVEKYWFEKEWREPKRELSVKQLIDGFIERYA